MPGFKTRVTVPMTFRSRVGWLGPASVIALTALATLLPGGNVHAQDFRRPDEITPHTEAVIRRALDYLAAQQNPEGYWIEHIGRKVNEEYRAFPGRHVGVTALACMAFLSNGSTPGCGRYGDNVDRGLSWLLTQVRTLSTDLVTVFPDRCVFSLEFFRRVRQRRGNRRP